MAIIKKIFIYLIFQLVSLNTQSQTSKKWTEYYALIDSAEISIVDSIYNSALNYYNKAFSIVDKPYGKDLYNASLCASNLEAFKTTTFLLNQLVDKGITRDYFENHKYFASYRNSDSWKEFLNSYEVHRDTLRKHINLDLRNKIIKMIDRDQYFTQKKYDPGYGDSVFIVGYKNVKNILEIINYYGFPDSNMIGLEELSSECLFQIILIHFYQCKAYFNDPKFINSERRIEFIKKGIDFNYINLDSILKNAIFEGKYNPTSMYSLQGSPFMLQIDDTISLVDYNKQTLHKLDSIRRLYGLCNMELLKKKGVYDLKAGNFRPKLKTESVTEYLPNQYINKKSYNFGVSILLSMFFTGGDKDHTYFKGIYNDLLVNPFSYKPAFTDIRPTINNSFKELDMKKVLKKTKPKF